LRHVYEGGVISHTSDSIIGTLGLGCGVTYIQELCHVYEGGVIPCVTYMKEESSHTSNSLIGTLGGQNLVLSCVGRRRVAYEGVVSHCSYGFATMSRLLKIIGLFCKRAI